MTRNEWNKICDTLPPRKDYNSWTDEQKQLDRELNCISMIDSCLCYGTQFFGNYDKLYTDELGEQRVKELYEQQKAELEKATIIREVYTDGEGVSYSSIVYADEVTNQDNKFKYQLLDRLKSDCDYYLGNGNRNTKDLWSKDEVQQIITMKALYDSFSDADKPEWISLADIERYESQMCKENEFTQEDIDICE